MKQNVSQKLISEKLVSGQMKTDEEIGVKIDQTLTQDATGTMVMLELEAIGLDRVKTEVSCQYVDHNLVQNDFKNPDDHLFLMSAAKKFGLHFSRAGNGVSHPVHMENFGKPGNTMLGSDSHTCAAGSLGMLAIGTGGLEVAMAMCGEPFYFNMPKVMGIELKGELPPWVSAKDIILEILRRHSVRGGVGKIFEYYGSGLSKLSAMDRHVIANMGAELGATTSVFPSDMKTKEFLALYNRERDWVSIEADKGASYDQYESIDLSSLEPLIACPTSPDRVVTVKSVSGKKIFQSMIGSSANPGDRDYVIPALMVKEKQVKDHVSFDINPSSRQNLQNMTDGGYLSHLIKSGARIHQPGCNGCIGMGQAPATDKISLRTVPRNFPGRSGTKEDKVYLCSPETAAASALTGVITDPRDLNEAYPKYENPKNINFVENITYPPNMKKKYEIIWGPNIKPLPKFEALMERVEGPVLLKMGGNVSTDEILPAGSKVLPLRSNINKISEFTFSRIDEDFYKRSEPYKKTGFFVIAGENYGQGSSREHAAICPRFLGLRMVIAISYARIHRKNLINFGIIPLMFKSEEDYKNLEQNDTLIFENIKQKILSGTSLTIENKTQKKLIEVEHDFSQRDLQYILAGGLINLVKKD